MKRQTKPELTASKLEILPIFTAFFTVGIAASALFAQSIHLVFLFTTLSCLLLSFPEAISRYRVVFLCIGALASGLFYGNLRIVNHDPGDFLKLDGTMGTLTGSFTGDYNAQKSGGVSFKLSKVTYEFDEQMVSIPGQIRCQVAQTEILPEPEQTYSLTGKFISPEPGRIPAFRSQSMTPVANHAYAHKLAGKFQRQIRIGLNSVLPKNHAAILNGFILGDTSQISSEDRRLFRETGISHLLAVSGQHVMIVIMLLAAILHWLKIPPLSRSVLIVVILTAYAMTTAGSPSVWRALTMYFCVAAVLHLEAFPSPIRPVATACLLLLLYDPAMIFSAAFQLSFIAVLSIVLLRPPIEHLLLRMHLPDFLSRYLAVTFAANLGTMPMTAYLFGTVSASALLVNPLILWSFCYILPVAFLTAALSVIWPASAIIVAPGLSLFLDGLMSFLQKFNAIPGSFFYVGNLSGITIVTAYSLMLFVAARFNQRQVMELAGLQSENTAATPAAGAKTFIKKPRFGNHENQKQVTEAYPKPEISELRLQNIFRSEQFVRQIDAMMLGCKRRPLKNSNGNSTLQFPVNLLNLDNQNLFYQLIDLDRNVLKVEPERLLQAHVFLLALVGGEILNRISFHLNPPPSPNEIRIEMIVRDRYLATAVLTDSLLNSALLTRASDEGLMLIVSRVQTVFSRARNQLERILGQQKIEESMEQHLLLRHDLLIWCREFMEYDLEMRRRQNSNLRSEQ